jgi:hypothetical protein
MLISNNEKEIDTKKKTVYYFDVEETKTKRRDKSFLNFIKSSSFKKTALTLFFINFGICIGLLVSFLIKDYTVLRADTWKVLAVDLFGREWHLLFLFIICCLSFIFTICYAVISIKRGKKKTD